MDGENDVNTMSQPSFLSDPRTPAHSIDGAAKSALRGDNPKAVREIDTDFLLRVAAPFADDRESDASGSQSSEPEETTAEPSPSPASFFDPGSAASFFSSGPATQHFGRVLIVGPTSSGKTTFKQMIEEDRIFLNLTADAQPSLHSSGTRYSFAKSMRGQSERVTIDLVDTGPLQRCGLTRFYAPADLIVLTWSLATVKQVKTRSGFLSTTEAVVFHPRDIHHLSSVIRDLTIAVPGAPLVVIGTHKDVLSERSVTSVEKVVQQLQNLVTKAVDDAAQGLPADQQSGASGSTTPRSAPASAPGSKAPSPQKDRLSAAVAVASTNQLAFQPLVVLGCYAVARNDNKCVSVGGGVLHNVSSVWQTLCESVLKGARSTPLIRSDALRQLVFFDNIKQFSNVVARVSQFIACLRDEHGVCLLGLHELSQALFAFGTPSKATADAILKVLVSRGELVVLSRTREYSKQALLFPHLPSRIVSSILSVAQALKATFDERVVRSKLINIDDCVSADPPHDLSKGILRMNVVKHLACCIPQEVTQDRLRVFVRVARQIGFMFSLQDAASAASPRRIESDSSFASTSTLHSNEKFIIPNLITATVAPTTYSALSRECEMKRVHCAARHVYLAGAPSSFVAQLQCELGVYVRQRTHVTRTSLWLTQEFCRAYLWVDKDPTALPDVLNLYVWFFGATGTGSVRTFALFLASVMDDVLRVLRNLNVESASNTKVSNPRNPAIHDGAEAMALGTFLHDDSAAALLRLDLSIAPLAG